MELMILFLAKVFRKLRPVSAIVLQKDGKLLIVQKPRKHHVWQFPQGGVEKGETFLVAAERELHEECGENLQIEFVSKKKIGEFSYFFPKNFVRRKKEIAGANVQFFLADLISGEVQVDNEEIIGFKWVRKEELKDFFEEGYLERIVAMIN